MTCDLSEKAELYLKLTQFSHDETEALRAWLGGGPDTANVSDAKINGFYIDPDYSEVGSYQDM